jgi:hypothetical protein
MTSIKKPALISAGLVFYYVIYLLFKAIKPSRAWIMRGGG